MVITCTCKYNSPLWKCIFKATAFSHFYSNNICICTNISCMLLFVVISLAAICTGTLDSSLKCQHCKGRRHWSTNVCQGKKILEEQKLTILLLYDNNSTIWNRNQSGIHLWYWLPLLTVARLSFTICLLVAMGHTIGSFYYIFFPNFTISFLFL